MLLARNLTFHSHHWIIINIIFIHQCLSVLLKNAYGTWSLYFPFLFIQGRGYLDVFSLNYFFRVRHNNWCHATVAMAGPRLSDGGNEENRRGRQERLGRERVGIGEEGPHSRPSLPLPRLFSSFPPSESLEQATVATVPQLVVTLLQCIVTSFGR